MSTFNLANSHNYWYNFKDQSIYKVVLIMESIEADWSIDNNNEKVDNSLDVLAKCIDNLNKIDFKNPEKITKAIAHLKISQLLRILQSLETILPSAAASILDYAEKNQNSDPYAKVFLSRNVVFERLRLLSRIIAPERLSLIQSALEEAKHG